VYAQLKNNVEIVAVHAGYCFSFIKPQIKSVHFINVKNKGSQFRSRDFYPQTVVGLVNKQYQQFIGAKVSVKSIPAIPKNKIIYIDGYGNIKTSIRQSQIKFKSGQKIRIEINGNVRTASCATGNFSVKMGDLAFAPGSSGGKDPFMEVFLRSGDASKLFLNPSVETDIILSPLT